MEDKFLKLTNSVYKVLEFFPESDPLKNRAKDKALAIMDSLILMGETSGWMSFQKEKLKVQVLEDIDTLLGYLWIGKMQGWLNSANYLIINSEYEKIKRDLGPVLEPTQKLPGFEPMQMPVIKPEPVAESIEENNVAEDDDTIEKVTERQSKILEYLKNNETAQVMNLQAVLPNVTKRTIRRDLDRLLESGAIEREGDFNEVSYKIKG